MGPFTDPSDRFSYPFISSRIFENIPQNGPEHSHRKLAIASFLVTAVRKNIGGLLSWLVLLGSLSNNVFERRTSTGSGLFSFFDGVFAQIFSQIASITVKKLRNTNFISSRHVKRENTSLPVDVRRSKTPLLKLPNLSYGHPTYERDYMDRQVNPPKRVISATSTSI